ncbi:solute carrier family 22 member 5-like isoform X1 [Vespa mandarinia]|uniref:solute carrier family 22 member 5-like isoform X1 n=2 Tax=Vespa mandarinia TaxID=7446 RepID=UPI00161A2975|nr:solute carrier family 22 member 5-like isoform X1 [Vespa mandarinia]XP_035739431.1 solute carrier family 22 member 5-like isoform X1 [Vespa mandarinia]
MNEMSVQGFYTSKPDSLSIMKKDILEGKNETPRTQDLDRFGLYQMMMYAILSIPLLFSAGFALLYVFTAGEVKYRCLVPECENSSDTVFSPPWILDSAPKIDGTLATCTRYAVKENPGTCSSVSFQNITQNCNAWFYDPNEHTILNEWDFTCDNNRWRLTLVGTINNVGQLVGLIFAGYISDKYGRRTMLTGATFISGISGLIHSFSVNYWMFLGFEFMDAVAGAGIYSAGFILGMELTGAKNRVLGNTITNCMFALGEIILGLIAMWLRSWRTLLRVVYGPALLAIFLPYTIPESVRWLMANGKSEEVERVYRKMAEMNGLEISDETIRIFKELNVLEPANKEQSDQKTNEKGPIKQVLHSSIIMIRLLICSFCWLTNTFIYYGLSLNSVAFAGDKYMNFILVAVVEIPAHFLTWLLTDYIGRKATLSGSFIFSGLFCLAIQFLPSGGWLYTPLILYMGGKWCITMSFSTVYLYTAEMFPTNLRHSLLGICSMTGRIGSILAPQTPLLMQILPELPLVIFGSMAILAGVFSLIFPETLGTKLPDTVWEAENIGKTKLHSRSQELPS